MLLKSQVQAILNEDSDMDSDSDVIEVIGQSVTPEKYVALPALSQPLDSQYCMNLIRAHASIRTHRVPNGMLTLYV